MVADLGYVTYVGYVAYMGRHVAWVLAVVALATGCPRAPAATPTAPPVAAANEAGPIADYESMAGVTIHVEADEMAPELRPTLQRLLGGRLVVAGWSAPSTNDPDPTAKDLSLRWMRDYQPIFVRDEQGELMVVHYLAPNPNRNAFQAPAPSPRRRGRTWIPTPEGGAWLPSRTLPLVHENGNLLVAGRHLFVSEKLITDNAEVREDPHLVKSGYRPRSRKQVVELLARTLRRAPEDVVVLPPMPYESTEHVDLFLLPLDQNTVMIPRIETRALDLLEGREREVGEEIQRFLDAQANTLHKLGLSVPRWPMIPPTLAWTTDDDDSERAAGAPGGADDGDEPASEGEGEEEGEDEGDDHDEVADDDFELWVFSPANALLLNVTPGPAGEAAASLAILPSFHKAFDDASMKVLSQKYTASWEASLRRRGYTTVRVDASDLVGYLGLLRCVSAPIPPARLVASRTRPRPQPGRGRAQHN